MSSEEYLTIDEVAVRLKLSPKTIKNKMASGIFRRGVHYFSPRGLRPRFKWSAVQAWLEEKDQPGQQEEGLIPMARGYFLGKPRSG
ncbi:MAG: helix-turn-helix domain-containing protein [Deltaproteobacteria bacterium]|nr:helix-turn-helix domain-containing protein [Deltaproteobacteria bacterium]